MKKWAYPLLIAFVAFFIFSNPAESGTQGRAFVIWMGDLAGAVGEFLDGLFDDDAVTTNNDNLVPGTSDGGGTGVGAAPLDESVPSNDTGSNDAFVTD